MSRKPTKGYFVKGQFVAEGSELDLELKAELKGTHDASRTDLKRESDELQELGKELLTLRADLLTRLDLPDKLAEALREARRITNFEGKRRQMQFVGKLMRKLDPEAVQAVRDALTEQRSGSAKEKLALHQAEQWRDQLLAQDSAQAEWIAHYPGTDIQQLRALIRQARKDAPTENNTTVSQGLAPRKGRAYRELFALVREQVSGASTEEPDTALDEDSDGK
ncbi:MULTISPECIES: ribosome biogenesis factor YjgA [unclassified Simplicispira]|uniref:ribosome biogenesis factor YjgA n=1 Tax=unclassified Simplicispira TaxID=2630407 RepID=UPI000D5DA888|nr:MULTISPECIES: ribosome biogenesis factor YjgA [unclassified Simplicispira]PVY55300.1 ribosome-associated protein [Simplicispira sp. 125]REG16243.1 ribosome-associated protein [Simplicispira sp. 110]